MSNLKISPSDQSSTPSFGPTHEIYNGLTSLQKNLDIINSRIEVVEAICARTEVLNKAYTDLHSKRIVFLVVTVVGFVVFTSVCMFATGIAWGSYDWILKLGLGATSIGLLVEVFWFPNKVKDLDRSNAESRKMIEGLKATIEQLNERIAQVPIKESVSGTPTTRKANSSRTKTRG